MTVSGCYRQSSSLQTRGRSTRALRQVKRGLSRQGFTLIELLVVIVIIAVLTTFVTVNLGFRNTGKAIRNEALRIGVLMQLASDQAIYSRMQFGIRFHPESYEFYTLTASEEGAEPLWQIVDDKRFAARDPEVERQFQVDIEGIPIVLETLADEQASIASIEEEPVKPHVLFLSNGEVMPDFKIVVEDKDAGEHRYQVFSGEEEPVIVEKLE